MTKFLNCVTVRCRCVLAGGFILCAAAAAFGAVKPGENILLNGKLEADQADFPPYWQANHSQFKWHPTGGPDGLPYVTVCGEKSPDVRMKQFGLNLVSNGVYRMSMRVRSRDLLTGSPSGLVVVNNGLWVSTAGVMSLPEDTGGDWKPVSAEFRCFTSAGGYYAMIYVLKQRGQLDVADFKLEAVDELALKGTGVSKQIECLARPRLVPQLPLLAKIPADDPKASFRFFGDLEGKDSDYEVVCVADGSRKRVTRPLVRGAMEVRLPEGATNGQMIVGVVRKSTGEAVVRNRYNFGTVPVCRKPATGRRRLNNLATEVLSVDLPLSTPRRFQLSRDGWAFIAVRGATGATVRVDGQEVIGPQTPRGETFRRLSAGEHDLEIAGGDGGSVVVREIAEILNYCPGVNSGVGENPPYDWDFQERYVLPAVTTQLGGVIPNEHFADFRRRGYESFDNLNLTGGKAEVMIEKLSRCGGLVNAWRDGVACDEQSYADSGAIDDYAQGFWAFDIAKRPTKPVYTWVYGKPAAEAVALDFCAACFNVSGGRGKILSEIYCRTRETEDEARKYLRTYVGDTMDRYREWCPGGMGSVGVVYGNFNQVPILSIAHHPEVDYKHYLDMQMNFVANDPSCRGLGLVGYWGSYYADDEMHRWSFALMRHYVVEGRTDMLSDAHGFRYRPDHVLNGDFRGTLAPWTATGEVRTDSYDNFASKSQNRWGGNDGVGDTFAVLVRGEGEQSTLSQTIRGLVPGRKYCLQFATFDVKDVKANRIAPRQFAIAATLSEGAEIDRALSWVHVDKRVKGRYAINDGVARINLHHIVFTAKSAEVGLTLDNGAASAGEELGVNFVSVNPYFAARALEGGRQ